MNFYHKQKNKLLSLIESAFPLLFLVPLAPYIGGLLFAEGFSGAFPVSSFLGLIVVCILFISGFNIFNSVYDHKIDFINKSFRGIPSGIITKKEALLFSFICFAISLFLSLLINIQFFIFILINIFLAVLYSLPPIRLKEKYVISNVTIAFSFGLIPALLGLSIFGEISESSLPFLFSILFLYTSVSFLKDFEDHLGDKMYGVKTFSSVLGLRSARKWIIFSIFCSYFFILGLTFFGFFRSITYMMGLFFFWILYINNLLVRIERGEEKNITTSATLLVWHMTLFGSVSILVLAILNTIF